MENLSNRSQSPVQRSIWKTYRVISNHLGWVRCVAFDPSNDWFCTGSADRTIKIWDVASGWLKSTLTGHIGQVRSVAVSDRQPYMFSAGDDKQVKCWDLEQNKVIRSFHGHLSGVYCLALHPTIDVMITGGRDSVGRVWDIRTEKQIFALSGHRDTVCSVFARSLDPQVVTGSHDTTVKFWDLRDGKTMGTLTHHKKSVRALVQHPVVDTFASASADNVKKFNLPRGEFMRNMVLKQKTIINAMAVNKDGVLVNIFKPTNSEKLEDWMAVHSMLVSWITNTLDFSIRSTLGEYDDAQLLWNNLKNRYCVVNGTRICQLKSALGECKQGNTETVAIYFGRLSKLWDELNTYVKVPVCKCGTCKCNIVDQVEKLREEDYVHHFLIGLDAAYSSIRAQLLAQDPLPGVDKAYQQVIQTERLRGDTHTFKDDHDNIMAFQVEYDARAKSKNFEGDKFCTHCNREGHDESGCFQIHGYSEWRGDRPRGGRGRGRGGTLAMRGGRHGGRFSGRGHVTPVSANNIFDRQSGQHATQTAGGKNASGLAGFSANQIRNIRREFAIILSIINAVAVNKDGVLVTGGDDGSVVL